MSCVCVARQGNNFAVTIAPEPPCIGLRRHKRRHQRREAGFCRGHGRYGWHSLPELSGDFPQAICMWKTARFLHPRRDQGRSFPCVSSNPFHQCSGRDEKGGVGRGGEGEVGRGRERREKGEGRRECLWSALARSRREGHGREIWSTIGSTPFAVAHGAQSTKSWATDGGRP